jgi:hypothetical protein
VFFIIDFQYTPSTFFNKSNMVGHGKADDGRDDVKGAIASLRYQAVIDTSTSMERPGLTILTTAKAAEPT